MLEIYAYLNKSDDPTVSFEFAMFEYPCNNWCQFEGSRERKKEG